MGTSPSLSAQCGEINMNIGGWTEDKQKRAENGNVRLTHCLRTSATREASSALKIISVPFPACNFINSLNDRPSLPPPRLRPGVSSTPSLGNTTEFRGVKFVRPFTREGLISPSERSQSSEPSEREDNVKFSLKDMAVVVVVVSGVDGAEDGDEPSRSGRGQVKEEFDLDPEIERLFDGLTTANEEPRPSEPRLVGNLSCKFDAFNKRLVVVDKP